MEQYSDHKKKRIVALEIVFLSTQPFYFFYFSSIFPLFFIISSRPRQTCRSKSLDRPFALRTQQYVCVTGHRWLRKNRKLSNWRVRGPSAPRAARRSVCGRAGVGGWISEDREEEASSFILSSSRRCNMQNIGYYPCTHTHIHSLTPTPTSFVLPPVYIFCANAFIRQHYYSWCFKEKIIITISHILYYVIAHNIIHYILCTYICCSVHITKHSDVYAHRIIEYYFILFLRTAVK